MRVYTDVLSKQVLSKCPCSNLFINSSLHGESVYQLQMAVYW